MAAVTICSDFGAPQNKVWHCFCCFPIYFSWSDGTRCNRASKIGSSQFWSVCGIEIERLNLFQRCGYNNPNKYTMIRNCCEGVINWYIVCFGMRKSLSHVWLFVTAWIVACQAPLSMGFSKQKSWGGLPFPSPWALPDPGIEPRSPALQADSLPFKLPGKSGDFGERLQREDIWKYAR